MRAKEPRAFPGRGVDLDSNPAVWNGCTRENRSEQVAANNERLPAASSNERMAEQATP
jgi:hypothetical protein